MTPEERQAVRQGSIEQLIEAYAAAVAESARGMQVSKQDYDDDAEAIRSTRAALLDEVERLEGERKVLREALREAIEMARQLNTPISLNGRFICAQCGAGDGTATHIRHYAHCAYMDLANRTAALLTPSPERIGS